MGREGVPLIDIQNIDQQGLAKEIVKVCEEWGCFRMVNHGVPTELMAEMKLVVASLFDLPTEIKSRTTSSVYGKGYIARNPITPFFESFSIDDISSSSTNEFCDHLAISPYQREVINKYTKAIRDLAGILGHKLKEGSGLSGDLFDDQWCCQFRMNKYHYTSESIGKPGIHMHSDPSFLTVLLDDYDVNGLQIVDKNTGDFVPLDPVPGTLVANIGDIGKAWSNGRYCSAKHRVWCFEAKTRYSMALFVLGPKDKKVEAPSEFIESDHKRLYVPIEFEKYRQFRISAKLSTDDALDLFSKSAT
uniref:2-oxoglutarate-dependent dioxygenase DAO-like n=1 Tax=Erigeron canadensis TaxID=72917 RepID=UPI001CB959AF|nr:2-oxoglutarate-dependent dioxygenase DAO-like [Erigeron canadensis]